MGSTKFRRRRSSSRGFLCFVPAVDGEDERTGSSAGSSVRVPEDDLSSLDRSRRPRRALIKVFRSAAFVSALNRIGRSRRNPRKGPNALDERSVTVSSPGSTNDGDRIFSTSSPSSSSSSSGLFSSPTSVTPPEPKQRRRPESDKTESEKPSPGKEQGNYHPTTGLCLLVISLFLMVTFGRLFAIIWTATWLYVVPRRMIGSTRPRPGSAELRPKVSEEDEKKRVVLEGLMERNRRF